MKKIFSQWKNAWRTSFYYIWFSMWLGIFFSPIHLGKIDVIKNNNTIEVMFYVSMILLYFPFAVYWASKTSGLHPLTKKEALEKEKNEKEEYKSINQKNK